MSNKITGKEYPLLKIFSSDFEYHIPAYQRPYAWGVEQTGTLFDDLYDFFQTEEADNYFLGSIVLIKEEGKPFASVIDGQQRLTTLSILFAVLATCFKDLDLKKACMGYLQEAGNKIAGIKAQPRLFLRDKDQPFFNKYIQSLNLNDLKDIDPAQLSTEAQVHIQENAHTLIAKFSEVFDNDEELVKFSQFLLNRCFLIAVSTANEESAFRIFSVMNSRGLDLMPIDIVKSEVIGKLPAPEQEAYTEKWEDMENLTGREGFNEVFTHTRTIFAKERPRKNLLEEFREYVLKKTTTKSLIDDYLEPYTKVYYQLRNQKYSSTKYADEINSLLHWLNRTNNYDWMPPAIKFIADHKNDSEYTLWFIQKLERLASYLFITGKDVHQRMERYKWVLVEMDSRPDNSLSNPLSNIELTEWEKRKFLEALDGEIYTMTSLRRNYILQRLDSFVSAGGATYNSRIFTIEHVLPQHPAADSEWMALWPDKEEQTYWLNRIANLVPLTRQRNAAAQNYDFKTKKYKYFQTKGGVSMFALTTQVINVDAWTPEVVVKRQHYLMDVFKKKWDLIPSVEIHENTNFMLAGRGANATGYPTDGDSFVVLAGSDISPDVTDGFQPNYLKLRNELIDNGVIEDNQFTRDYQFSSTSAAAAVILGRSANGRKEWTKLDGRTIAQSEH
jgi:uncharacterized protein with ParB-like and HNH nuclease domain